MSLRELQWRLPFRALLVLGVLCVAGPWIWIALFFATDDGSGFFGPWLVAAYAVAPTAIKVPLMAMAFQAERWARRGHAPRALRLLVVIGVVSTLVVTDYELTALGVVPAALSLPPLPPRKSEDLKRVEAAVTLKDGPGCRWRCEPEIRDRKTSDQLVVTCHEVGAQSKGKVWALWAACGETGCRVCSGSESRDCGFNTALPCDCIRGAASRAALRRGGGE